MTVRPSVVGSCTSIHLDRVGHLVEHRPRCQARRQWTQPSCFSVHAGAAREERDKDVCLDPLIGLMVDRADRQIPLQFLEGLFHLDQLQIERPELRRIAARHIRPQQVAAFPASRLAQLRPVKFEAERLCGVDRLDPCPAAGCR